MTAFACYFPALVETRCLVLRSRDESARVIIACSAIFLNVSRKGGISQTGLTWVDIQLLQLRGKVIIFFSDFYTWPFNYLNIQYQFHTSGA